MTKKEITTRLKETEGYSYEGYAEMMYEIYKDFLKYIATGAGKQITEKAKMLIEPRKG